MSKNGGEAVVNESNNQIEEKQDEGETNGDVRDDEIEEEKDERERGGRSKCCYWGQLDG